MYTHRRPVEHVYTTEGPSKAQDMYTHRRPVEHVYTTEGPSKARVIYHSEVSVHKYP